jgi:2-dehydro-3-deoxygluconokinase
VAGDSLNTAIYLCRSSRELTVDYITCLGDDPISDRISDFMSDNGIGTSQIKRILGASPGLYAITTTVEGERSFTYWRSSSAARQLFADGDFSALENYDAVYLSGVSMAILPHSVRLGLLEWLNQSLIKVIYDSNYRPNLWEKIEDAQKITSAFWRRADIALPSIDDEMLLFDETAVEVTARFSANATTGALKRGEQGPLSLGTEVHQTYALAPKVVDTTAAGDSFNGGYLGSLLSGNSQADALMEGHNLAMCVVQHRGAIIPE